MLIEFWCLLGMIIVAGVLTGVLLPLIISSNSLPLHIIIFVLVVIIGLWGTAISLFIDYILSKNRKKKK